MVHPSSCTPAGLQVNTGKQLFALKRYLCDMQHSRPITANVKLGLVVSSGIDDLFIINLPMMLALHLIITAGHALWVSCLMPTNFLPADHHSLPAAR